MSNVSAIVRHNRIQITALGRAARLRLRPRRRPRRERDGDAAANTTSGELQLVQTSILFRHGDRSPSHNVFEPAVGPASHEAFAWAAELPDSKTLDELERYAPTRYGLGELASGSSQPPRPRDAELGSFGCLSRVGVYQATDLGCWLQGFYEPAVNASLRITSSNYARTIKSAQAVVRSFLPGDVPAGTVSVQVHEPAEEFLNVYPFFPALQRRMAEMTREEWFQEFDARVAREKSRLEQLIPVFSYRLRKFSWLTCQDHFRCRELRRNMIAARSKGDKVSLDSRESQVAPASAVAEEAQNVDDNDGENDDDDDDDVNDEKARTFGVGLGGVTWTDSWLYRESIHNLRETFERLDTDRDGMLSRAELGRAINDLLPHSSVSPRDLDRLFEALDENGGGGISWEEFAKLLEGGLPVLNEPKDEAELWTMRDVVEKYTIQRFGMWYEDPHIRNMATGALAAALSASQTRAIEALRTAEAKGGSGRHASSTAPPPVQYDLLCGHDVTVLPLLHLLGAKREASEWPGYCSVLMLELLRCPEEDAFFVRALWHPGRTGVGLDDSQDCVPLVLLQGQMEDEEDGGRREGELIPLEVFTALCAETAGAMAQYKRAGGPDLH